MQKSENQNEELPLVDENFSPGQTEQNSSQIQGNQLGKSQKIAVAVLAFFAFFVFFFWIAQFKKNLSEPFNLKTSPKNNAEQTYAGNDNSEADLKKKDTDKDGLNDWDELNVYKTSPYLEDSDSDGFSDKEEIQNDKDPNCPAGRDCGSESQTVAPENGATENIPAQTAPVSNQPDNLPPVNISEQAAQNILSGQGDAKALRDLLVGSGVDKNALDAISDEDLMKFYQETLKDGGSNAN